MSIPILSSKLQTPSLRPDLVKRPRLIAHLNNGLHRKLTLISAPAGFGKTTIIRSWIAGSDRPAAWLSLDARDNDPVRFLAYVVAALQTIDEDIGILVSEALQSSQPPSVEVVLTSLLNEIIVIQDDFCLALDDYHLLESSVIDDGLTFLLDHLPAQMHLVIITREDPQFPLSRLRVHDQLTELRVADLRFTPDEAAEFLNRAMGLTLSAQDIDALEKRTEGWIAGLQLAALSLQGRANVTDFIQMFTGSHHFIVDYLLEEVLQRQPQAIREFLLHTSILDQLNSALCDAVAGRTDSQQTLEMLERNNLFVIALDNERGWYRYHHLFGDALRNTLNSDHPNMIPMLHRRASNWYAERDQIQHAISHALAGQDNDRAADLIETTWATMDSNYQSAAWISQVQQLPDDLIRRSPVLCAGYGWTLLYQGDLESAELWFQAAERWLNASLQEGMRVADTFEFEMLPATLHSARAYRALAFGDTTTTLDHAQAALHLSDERHSSWTQAMALSGVAYWAQGYLVEADRAISDLIAYMRRVGRMGDAAELVFVVGEARWARGEMRRAFELYQETFQILSDMGNPPLIGVEDLHRGVVDFYREWGEWERAEDHLMTAQDVGALALSRPDWQHRLNLTAARLRLSQGNLEAALDFANQAVSHYSRSPIPPVRMASTVRALIWIRQGNLEMASRWAHEAGIAIGDELTYLNTFTYLTFARLLIARGDFDQAEKLLVRLLQSARDGESSDHAIEALILTALVYDARKQRAQAVATLKEALTLAEPIGYFRLFLDEGPPLLTLLRQIVEGDTASAYARRLLASLNSKEPSKLQPVSQPLIDPLSERELDVLRLLSTELTGPEIARQLVISLSTMRTHTRNIYSKLDVSNRRAAVRRAEELSLL